MEFEIQKASNENSGVVNQLQYKLGHVANYIVDRKSSLYYPSGGSTYAPRASKTLRFHITADNGWLDCSTLNVRFKFNNLDAANEIRLLNALPANMFYRLRIIANNQVIEDISYYNRVYNMIHTLLPAEKKYNDYMSGFGSLDDIVGGAYVPLNFESTNTPPQVLKGDNRVVQFHLFSGLLSQTKYLPLHYLKGLVIELELVSSVADCVVGATDATDWSITEPVVLADVITLDQSLENEFAQALLDGESLPIHFDSFASQISSMPAANEATISLSRSFTRLKAVFITFYNSIRTLRLIDTNSDFEYTDNIANDVPLNQINHFYNPNFISPGPDLNKMLPFGAIAGGDPELKKTFHNEGYYKYTSMNDRLSLQVQIGAKLYPEQPIENLCTAYYHLRKTLDIVQPSSFLSMNINDREYRSHKFICALDLQKCQSANFSGINTKASDLITVKLKNLAHVKVLGANPGQILAKSYPEYMYCTLNYSAVLLISDRGISVLE